MNAPISRGRPYRSKLLPFASHIARWQREGKTYREMAEALRISHGIEAHPDTINSFVLVRVRGRKRAMLSAQYLTQAEQPGRKTTAVPNVSGGAAQKPHGKRASEKILGADGKEIVNAQYAPANPIDL